MKDKSDCKKVVRRMTGWGAPRVDRFLAKITDEEASKLCEAYEKNDDPRGVMAKIRDRLADGKEKPATALEQKTSGESKTNDK